MGSRPLQHCLDERSNVVAVMTGSLDALGSMKVRWRGERSRALKRGREDERRFLSKYGVAVVFTTLLVEVLGIMQRK